MKIKLTFVVLLVVLLSHSCNNKPSSSDRLAPLKIDVPPELKDKKEIVEFIKDSEEAINLYSNTAEELAKDCKEFIGKKEEDLNMLDKVKMVAIFGQFTANFSQGAIKYSEMLDQTSVFEEGLTEEQTAALATVLELFNQRMEQLEEKYKDISVQP